jgi:hypothetical protein
MCQASANKCSLQQQGTTHQSAKDFLVEKEPQIVFPAGKQIEHNAILTRSINAMSRILRKDLYDLQHPGISTKEVEQHRPNPDPLAPIRYACVYWIEHFCESHNASNNAAVGSFLQKHFLHWLKALSLLKSASEGVLALIKLVSLLRVSDHILRKRRGVLIDKKSARKSHLLDLADDMRRFAHFCRGIVEKAPLQAYSSALIFSPTSSLTRQLFEGEIPGWIFRKSYVEKNWDSCVMTLEGHSGRVNSVAFSVDGRRLAVDDVVLCAGDEVGGRGGFDGVEDCDGIGRDATVAYEGRVGEIGWGEEGGDGILGVTFGGAAAAFSVGFCSCDACGRFDVACSDGDCDVLVGTAVRRELAKMPM